MRDRVVILGGSGHARMIAEILEERDEVEIAGFVTVQAEGNVYGYPCIQSDSMLPELLNSGVLGAFVAIGDNRRRSRCIAMVRSLGFKMINAISRDATVSRRAPLGEGIAIMPGARVNTGTVVEDGAILNTNSCLDHDCFAGACVHVAPGVAVAGKAYIEEGAFLGVGASVHPGIRIGSWSTIGAGASVVRDIPPNGVAYGVPARVHRYRSPEG